MMQPIVTSPIVSRMTSGMIGDISNDVISDISNDVISDVKETLSSKADVDSRVSRAETNSGLTGSSNVLTNLPQNALRHASDSASVEARFE
jgi:hypothetical protein